MFKRILVPLDGSELAERALPHAAALARAFDAALVLARVPEPQVVPVMSAGVWITKMVESGEALAEARLYLEGVAASEVLAGIEVEDLLPMFPVAQGILDAVAQEKVDLIVMTTHGHTGPARWVFGSVAERLIQVAPVPIYVVRAGAVPDDAPAIRRILVPLDGSELSERALPAASDLARSTGASIHLVRIPTVPGYLTVIPETAGWIPEQLGESAMEAERSLTARVDALREDGLGADYSVRMMASGGVADGILDEAEETGTDVIVMSSHGRSGVGRWFFGSVATRVLHGAHCAVWVVR